MKILYATSEARPFAASGGLADVAGSLPKALADEGHESIVVMPYYSKTISDELKAEVEQVTSFYVPVGWRSQYCGVMKTVRDGVTYYFIDNEYYFKRDFGLYGYYDDAERFSFFSRAILELCKNLDLQPDVINANDWQTALVSVYYYIFYKYDYSMRNIRFVFTIHNIAYQGQYGYDILEDIVGIPRHMASIVDYDGDINFMKGAFQTADKITTVSPTYAKEIFDPAISHGLDRALKNKEYKTCGFLNGIDIDLFNPETDVNIPAHFSTKNKSGKKKCKDALLEEVGLPVGDEPVMAIVTRFAEHKGIDLIKYGFHQMLDLGFKFVVLGSGSGNSEKEKYENFFHEMHQKYPDKVAFTCGYVPALAQRIYAGADFFLMPSKSEPCGLAQMISLRYGTIPVVNSVGGLKDSIVDYGDENGYGFTFQSYNGEDMLGAVTRAKEVYWKKKEFNALVTRAMKVDFSWKQSAKLYIGLYEEITSWDKG